MILAWRIRESWIRFFGGKIADTYRPGGKWRDRFGGKSAAAAHFVTASPPFAISRAPQRLLNVYFVPVVCAAIVGPTHLTHTPLADPAPIDSNGRMIWIADAHRGDGHRFIVRADEKLTAFVGT
jgi:hypothetical protein